MGGKKAQSDLLLASCLFILQKDHLVANQSHACFSYIMMPWSAENKYDHQHPSQGGVYKMRSNLGEARCTNYNTWLAGHGDKL